MQKTEKRIKAGVKKQGVSEITKKDGVAGKGESAICQGTANQAHSMHPKKKPANVCGLSVIMDDSKGCLSFPYRVNT